MTSEKKTKRKLLRKEVIRLTKWVDMHRDWIMQSPQPEWKQVQLRLLTDCEIQIDEHLTFSRFLKDMDDKDLYYYLPTSNRGRGRRRTQKSHLVRQLATYVARLFDELGEAEVATEIRDIFYYRKKKPDEKQFTLDQAFEQNGDHGE